MEKTYALGALLVIVGTLGLAGCGESSDETAKSGLPNTFGDCDAGACEVQLGAFTKDPGTTPYCPGKQADLYLDCGPKTVLNAGTCDELYAVTVVYGFAGDNYQCIYKGGTLVGARWTPDNHPRQFAGTQLPESCVLEPLCAPPGSDAGAD